MGVARSARDQDEDPAEPVGDGVQRRRVLRSGRRAVQDVVHGRLPAGTRRSRSRTTACPGSGPALDVVRGTNIVWPTGRIRTPCGSTSKPRLATSASRWRRYDFSDGSLALSVRPTACTGAPSADRTVRRSQHVLPQSVPRVWVFSLRADDRPGMNRYRRYLESRISRRRDGPPVNR